MEKPGMDRSRFRRRSGLLKTGDAKRRWALTLLLTLALGGPAFPGDPPAEPLPVLLWTSPEEAEPGQPWTVSILVDHPHPEEVRALSPELPPSLDLDRIRITPGISEGGDRRTLVEVRLIPRRGGVFSLAPFTVTAPGKSGQTPALTLRVRGNAPGTSAETSSETSSVPLVWDRPPAPVRLGEPVVLTLRAAGGGKAPALSPDFRVEAPANAILETLPPEGREGAVVLRLRLIPLEGPVLALPAQRIPVPGGFREIPPLRLPVDPAPLLAAGSALSPPPASLAAPPATGPAPSGSALSPKADPALSPEAASALSPEAASALSPPPVWPPATGPAPSGSALSPKAASALSPPLAMPTAAFPATPEPAFFPARRVCGELRERVRGLWDQGRCAEALALVRRFERDSAAGPFLVPLRRALEEALGLPPGPDEAWRPWKLLAAALLGCLLLGAAVFFITLIRRAPPPEGQSRGGVTLSAAWGYKVITAFLGILLGLGLWGIASGGIPLPRGGKIGAVVRMELETRRVPDPGGAAGSSFREGEPVLIRSLADSWVYLESLQGKAGWAPLGGIIPY